MHQYNILHLDPIDSSIMATSEVRVNETGSWKARKYGNARIMNILPSNNRTLILYTDSGKVLKVKISTKSEWG